MAGGAGSVPHVDRAIRMSRGGIPYDGPLIEHSANLFPEQPAFRQVAQNEGRDLFHKGELNSALRELGRAARICLHSKCGSPEVTKELLEEIEEARRAIRACH